MSFRHPALGRVMSRFGVQSCDVSRPDGAIYVELPRLRLMMMPGLQRLERAPDSDVRDYLHVQPIPPLTFANWRTAEAPVVTLHRTGHALQAELEVIEPVALVHDHRGRWKRHPPSKRKRMTSWRRAPMSERMRYEPLRSAKRIPRAWLHPDEQTVRTVCRVVLLQTADVYAQPSAKLGPQLDRLSTSWRFEAFRVARHDRGARSTWSAERVLERL